MRTSLTIVIFLPLCAALTIKERSGTETRAFLAHREDHPCNAFNPKNHRGLKCATFGTAKADGDPSKAEGKYATKEIQKNSDQECVDYLLRIAFPDLFRDQKLTSASGYAGIKNNQWMHYNDKADKTDSNPKMRACGTIVELPDAPKFAIQQSEASSSSKKFQCKAWVLNNKINLQQGWIGMTLADDVNKNDKPKIPQSMMQSKYFSAGVPAPGCVIALGGDPHVTNIKGESFDILQAGTFPILSLLSKKSNPTNATKSPLLHVDVSITRTSHECGEAYIENATLFGAWVTDMGYDTVQVRAKPSFIEAAIDGNWQVASNITSAGFKSPSPRVLKLKIQGVTVKIDILNYFDKKGSEYQARVHELGWSFLNMKFQGLQGIAFNKGVNIRGLLGYDDYTAAATPPEGCKGSSLLEGAASPSFLSSVSVE